MLDFGQFGVAAPEARVGPANPGVAPARGGMVAARPCAGDTPAAWLRGGPALNAESQGRSTLAAILRESSATGVLEFWES
jgi:hypothetical protein